MSLIPKILKMIKRPIIAVCLCLALVGVCAAFATYYHMRSELIQTTERYDYECPMHLHDLSFLIMFAAEKQDRIPKDLASLTNFLPWQPEAARWRILLYLCPAVKAPADPQRPDSFGYTYVDWSARNFARLADVPGGYPLAYDNSLSNHLSRGVYVLKVDGSVMFDGGGEWILEFSSRHPEYHIPIPQGTTPY